MIVSVHPRTGTRVAHGSEADVPRVVRVLRPAHRHSELDHAVDRVRGGIEIPAVRVESLTLVACPTTAPRTAGSFHSRSPIVSVFALIAIATTTPMTSRMIWVLRLYQPETRAIVSSNHASRLWRNASMSPPLVEQREDPPLDLGRQRRAGDRRARLMEDVVRRLRRPVGVRAHDVGRERVEERERKGSRRDVRRQAPAVAPRPEPEPRLVQRADQRMQVHGVDEHPGRAGRGAAGEHRAVAALEHVPQPPLQRPRAQAEDPRDELLDRRGKEAEQEEDERQADGHVESRKSGQVGHVDHHVLAGLTVRSRRW